MAPNILVDFHTGVDGLAEVGAREPQQARAELVGAAMAFALLHCNRSAVTRA